MQFYQTKSGLTLAALVGLLAPLCAQTPQSSAASRAITAPLPNPAEVIREIDDPSTGSRWLLFRNAAHPGGPGRLLSASASSAIPRLPGAPATNLQSLLSTPTAPLTSASVEHASSPQAPMIHAGDSLIVEESTPVVEARLAARALGPAACGAVLEARLSIGGKIVRVLAVAPGRAALVGAQP